MTCLIFHKWRPWSAVVSEYVRGPLGPTLRRFQQAVCIDCGAVKIRTIEKVARYARDEK